MADVAGRGIELIPNSMPNPDVNASMPAPRRGNRKGSTIVDVKNPLSELFGSRARAEVLRVLFGISHNEVYLNEIVRRTGLAQQGIDEQLRLFGALGLVKSRVDGNRRYYQANHEHPLFPSLRDIVLKTSGLCDVLAAALTSPKIEVAFVFGSIARREERADSDIDIMVVGEVGRREMAPQMSPLSGMLCREVNSHFYTRGEIARRVQTDDQFLLRVLESPKLFVVGDEAVLGRIVAESRVNTPQS